MLVLLGKMVARLPLVLAVMAVLALTGNHLELFTQAAAAVAVSVAALAALAVEVPLAALVQPTVAVVGRGLLVILAVQVAQAVPALSLSAT